MIKKVFYSGNSSTKPGSKEDSIINNFNIFVVPYDRVFYIWLSIILHILKLKPVLQCSYVKEWYNSRPREDKGDREGILHTHPIL